jgi:thiamine-phosphate pyrophosphorylase
VFLYYITDRKQLSADLEKSIQLLLERIRLAAEAGVDAIQLREKDLSACDMTDVGLRAVEIVNTVNASRKPETRTCLLINSRVDVAVACECDGVHLRSDDISAADARAVLIQARVKQALVGVSCHSVADVEQAYGHGADFVVLGPVFAKSGSEKPIGFAPILSVVKALGPRAPLPVLALGGVTLDNAAACMKAGAAGVAGIRLFQSGNVTETVLQLRSLTP